MAKPPSALILSTSRDRGGLAAARSLRRSGWRVGVGTPDAGGMQRPAGITAGIAGRLKMIRSATASSAGAYQASAVAVWVTASDEKLPCPKGAPRSDGPPR